MQKEIAYQMNNKSQAIANNKIFLSSLGKYETLNYSNYVEGDTSKMVFNNKDDKDTF